MKFYGLNRKKIKNALKNGFRFKEIVNITIKSDSSISNIHISYYLKLPMLILYREFLKNIAKFRISKKIFVTI